MKVLYDTSVLVAALLVEHSNHDKALPLLELAKRGDAEGYLSTHSLAELYAVMTRLPEPLKVLPDEAKALIEDLLTYLKPVPLEADDYQKAIARLMTLKMIGGVVFDAIIAQAALKAGVTRLITLNAKDFVRLGDEIAEMLF
ncbi:MAG: PIN domain-containing protein [Cyanobacteria bacterium J06631_9]